MFCIQFLLIVLMITLKLIAVVHNITTPFAKEIFRNREFAKEHSCCLPAIYCTINISKITKKSLYLVLKTFINFKFQKMNVRKIFAKFERYGGGDLHSQSISPTISEYWFYWKIYA